jgi:MerR family transcriptional regulator, redox-sensitive transcriptional activator SoxR
MAENNNLRCLLMRRLLAFAAPAAGSWFYYRTPTANDWTKMSAKWKTELDHRINRLIRLRDELSSCIGCGCLSLRPCPLYNPGDKLAEEGPGPRLLE